MTASVAVDDIVDDGARLGEHRIPIADYRRFAERMDRFQRIGRGATGLALKSLELVLETEFLHQPDDALRP
jgi:hypothetical protein